MLDDYEDFYKLIKSLKKDPDNTDKEKALEFLHHCYSWEYKMNLLDASLNQKEYPNITEYYKARGALEQTEEFKRQVNSHVEALEEYQEKKKQIEEADLVIQGTIWDTSGGLLEWAIRNGFIEDNFKNNHVLTWNVG